jgi:hypothetical protein
MELWLSFGYPHVYLPLKTLHSLWQCFETSLSDTVLRYQVTSASEYSASVYQGHFFHLFQATSAWSSWEG